MSDTMEKMLSRRSIRRYEDKCVPRKVLVMPANVPHAVYALTDFKRILTVVFPQT